MQNLLVTSLTGDNAIAAAVPALVIRVENIYEAPTSAGAEPDLDKLSDFLLNFNQA